MNELITVESRELISQIVKTKGECIPAIIENVRDTLLFTKTKAAMLRKAIEGIENIEGAGEMHDAMVEQRDNAVEAHAWMKARLGEITREMPKAQVRRNEVGGVDVDGVSKQAVMREQGISKQHASDAERIARNQWAIEEEMEEKRGTSRGPTESGILNRIREKEAREAAEKKQKKATDRVVRETPRLVAEYLESIKTFRQAINLAIAGAERDKFDPHAWNFLKSKHDELRALMAELEVKV